MKAQEIAKKTLSTIMNEVSKAKPSIAQINNSIHYDRTFEATLYISMLSAKELDQEAPNGFNPLHTAAYKNNEKIIRLLVSKKVDINKEDRTGKIALHYAAKNSNPSMCLLLANNGSTPDHKDKKGLTPSDYAEDHYIKHTIVEGSRIASCSTIEEIPLSKDEKIKRKTEKRALRKVNNMPPPSPVKSSF